MLHLMSSYMSPKKKTYKKENLESAQYVVSSLIFSNKVFSRRSLESSEHHVWNNLDDVSSYPLSSRGQSGLSLYV